MGSPLRLVTADAAVAAWPLVRNVFDEVERTLTRFASASPLTQLNRRAFPGALPRQVPALLAHTLLLSWRAYRMSNGIFDPRIIGALEAAGEQAGVHLPKSPPQLRDGERWLVLARSPWRAALTAPVDLGGIGKGLALRLAAHVLRRHGVERFLIEAGGDIVVGRPPPKEAGWRLSVEHPQQRDPAAVIEVANVAVATSSTAVHPAHLIDPRTLRPAAANLSSVTVLDTDPAWAEVWSKTAFIAGIDRVDARPTIWVTSDGTVGNSAPALRHTIWRRHTEPPPPRFAIGVGGSPELRQAQLTAIGQPLRGRLLPPVHAAATVDPTNAQPDPRHGFSLPRGQLAAAARPGGNWTARERQD
jgi:thiamine biosynthesis lipoprotein